MSGRTEELRGRILDLVAEYYEEAFAPRPFVPGQTEIPVCGRVFDGQEVKLLVDSALEFWLTSGRFAAEFEKQLARYFGIRSATLVNSGSSANLLSLSCLTSPKLGDRRLRPGDEVITAAAGFPTTVNPIVQNGLVPVFVDIELGTYNATAERVAAAIGPKTKAIMIAHALGNPFEVAEIAELAERHHLFLIEDNCD